ncbi:meiotically up-regulated gene 113-domain-containing protein [Phyllosticta citrichinensis]|uniref:Meiotically up-regulated gene 113-domain-containing protein n=1 Tax=Phyllosticta citrichinensis TaxID=1130410 RepID=A0ABR1XGU4_9PEZI
MPHFSHAPEARLGRNDSKNPATTCKGLTSAGKPCRRDISANKPSKNGVLAVSRIDDVETAAAFFCWQHKDQAEKLVQKNSNTHIVPLKERSSIDTLIGRLGILDVEDGNTKPGRKPNKTAQNGGQGKIQRPPTWNNVQGPLLSVPTGVASGGEYRLPVKKEEPSFWASLCCMCLGNNADDDYEIVRRKRQQGNQPGMNPSNKTSWLLSFIPSSVSPEKASQLLAEASKPISKSDEPGFIYIFWLTETTDDAKPSDRDASDLLSAPSRPDANRRTSDLLRSYSIKANGSSPRGVAGNSKSRKKEDKHILLKIGRANNVYRRMNEWQRQCGKVPSLVRYYPYVHSPQASPSGSPGPSTLGVRKCPHVHRVERLIHIELMDQRVMRDCKECGKQHKEWFEVEASRDGVKAVDGVVRRWVRYAEELVASS